MWASVVRDGSGLFYSIAKPNASATSYSSLGGGINFGGLIEMGVCLSYTSHPEKKNSVRYVHGMVAAPVLP